MSSSKWQLSQPLVELTAAPADVMHAPPSGLSLTAVSAMNFEPLTGEATAGAGCALRSRMTGLNATFDSLSAKSCSLQEVEQRRIAVGGLHRRSCRRWRSRVLCATCRTLWTILSKVPWPPRSGRIRLCVSRSPSSVILTPFRPNGVEPIDDLRGQQQPVGDDVDRACGRRAPRRRFHIRSAR